MAVDLGRVQIGYPESIDSQPFLQSLPSGRLAEFALGATPGHGEVGKINSVNSVSDNCTGMGVVAGFLADMGTIE
jgi:hypothetical protein